MYLHVMKRNAEKIAIVSKLGRERQVSKHQIQWRITLDAHYARAWSGKFLGAAKISGAGSASEE